MLASSRTPQRRPRSVVAAAATGALLLALAGCSGDPAPEEPADEPTAEPTSLGDYDTTGLSLVRGEFCERVSAVAVAAALGDDPTDTGDWAPGARLPGTRDISNEFGCSWSSGSASASAWVFAPPVTASRAADFADESVGTKCERLGGAAELGRPGVAQSCPDRTGIYGLVGDAWVGCEIDGTDVDAARVGQWCVAVLEALRAA